MFEQEALAPIGKRIAGGLVDSVLTLIAGSAVIFSWGLIESAKGIFTAEATWNGRGFLVVFFIDCALTCYFMTGDKQATLGQRMLGIKTIKENGTQIDIGTAIGRYVVSIFSSLLLKIGFITALFSKNKRTWHDMAAGTLVVNQSHQKTTSNVEQGSEVSDKNNQGLIYVIIGTIIAAAIGIYLSERLDRIKKENHNYYYGNPQPPSINTNQEISNQSLTTYGLKQCLISLDGNERTDVIQEKSISIDWERLKVILLNDRGNTMADYGDECKVVDIENRSIRCVFTHKEIDYKTLITFDEAKGYSAESTLMEEDKVKGIQKIACEIEKLNR
jgi:uncharacterized RDD family membrane protein YckC